MEDKNIHNAGKSLDKAENYFRILVDRAEIKCTKLWKLVLLESLDDVIKHFFGEAKPFSKERVEDMLDDNLFEVLDEMSAPEEKDAAI